MKTIRREQLVIPLLSIVTVLSIVSIIAIATRVATPPEIRIVVGVIFVLGAIYFRSIDPARHRRPLWTVPMFLIIGVVFILSGIHLYVPVTYRTIFETLAAAGFIALSLLAWFVVGVCYLREVPEPIEPLTNEVRERERQDGDDRL